MVDAFGCADFESEIIFRRTHPWSEILPILVSSIGRKSAVVDAFEHADFESEIIFGVRHIKYF